MTCQVTSRVTWPRATSTLTWPTVTSRVAWPQVTSVVTCTPPAPLPAGIWLDHHGRAVLDHHGQFIITEPSP